MQDLLHSILSRHTGQSVQKITDDFDRDYFMDPNQAVEYGIIDEVLSAEVAKEEDTKKSEKKDEKKDEKKE
jgi:ATP-dependent Clp protease, protease subunit